MLQHPGVSGYADVGQGCRRKDGPAAIGGISPQPKVVGGFPLSFPLRVNSAQMIHATFHQPVIDLEKSPASIAKHLGQGWFVFQFRRLEKIASGQKLISRGLLGI